MVFGEAPLSCKTTGTLTDSGVDETTATTLLFPNKAVATLSTSTVVKLPNEVEIRGTKGHIKVPCPFWCPTKLEVTTSIGEADLKTELYEFPLPKADNSFLHVNSAGFRYEAECVRQCLMKGLKECPTARLKESLQAAEILGSARRDVGYKIPADDL
ncbi:trans-1,2-dihydrobenzene-1,2-diol dehydrogenase-like [Patiria miniata]|uniref:GFO/IDH/MocA-like oxidoreductase domain-containing protein n=1 Tax=Patiria miniata TaxID=46514 RepID=A0A914BDW4_PATMI|nr:trans-1,2-dihydrobenzene-1,2-diol dehydrogenase-like [Patiria miniata]XP_038074155.1 trans-1,2-dihydrobenzene-1,2-diol dehydrogenase-like [Patiria miniata]